MPKKLIDFTWKYKYLLLFFVLFYLVLTQRFLNDKTNGIEWSVTSDGTGYYYYLPASLIYHDFSYSFYDNPKNKIRPAFKPYLDPYLNNTRLNRYYCGTAICILPFFLSACIISEVAGTPINGYTDTFLMMVTLAAICYFLVSIFLILKIGLFFSIPEKLSFLISLVFFFGTNLYHFVIQEPSMSHIYSFFAISLYFYLFIQFIGKVNLKNSILLGLSLGLVVLIRPPNCIVLLFSPFFFSSFSAFLAFFKELFQAHLKCLLIAFIVFCACVFIQLIFYYVQIGNFFVVSYQGRNFDFEDPQIFNVLLSYRKGLFLYTPFILLCLVYLLFAKRDWNKKISLFFTFSVFLYFTSSWWCWTYGGGLGNRPFIDIYPLILFSVLYFLNKQSAGVKRIAFLISLPFIFANQVMAYQYSHRIMDTYGNTTEENYWDIFMKTDIASINRNKIKNHLIGKTPFVSGINTFEQTLDKTILSSPGYKSPTACIVGEKNNFTQPFDIQTSQIGAITDLYIKAECMAKADKKAKMLGLVIMVSENNKTKIWEVVFFNQFDYGQDGWKYMCNIVKLEKYRLNRNSNIRIMVFSTLGNASVDDLKFSVYRGTN